MSILAFINAATNLSDYHADMIVAALRVQAKHFAAAWPGVPIMPPFLFNSESEFRDGSDLSEGVYPCVFVDNADKAGALGYHSVDKGGKYFVRIFVDLLLSHGAWNDTLSTCASHEFLETVLNPTCTVRYRGPARAEGSWYQKEASDPVEEDKYPVTVTRQWHTETIMLSNFVLPSYFDESTPHGAKVDYLGTCPGPFQLAPGGYMMVASDPLGKPLSVFGQRPPESWRMDIKELGRRALWK